MKEYLIEIYKWRPFLAPDEPREGASIFSSGKMSASLREDVLTRRLKTDEETISMMIKFIRDRLSAREVLQVSEIIISEEYHLIYRTENI